jgi:DNA-binding PadR family transcriptional regulator
MHNHEDHFDHRQHHGWHRLEAMARRGWGGWGRGPGGPGGRGAGWGDFGGFGDNFRIGRMLASGDLRLVALYFIEQQPRHGYDLIKAIEEKTSGIYVPSPGVIYPALTFLEEAGFATSVAEANKRLYTITDEGRTHLNDNRAAVETTLDYLGKIGERVQKVREHWNEAERTSHEPPHPDRDMADVVPELNEARRALKDAIRDAKKATPETQRHVADILRRAADEIRRAGREGADIDL